MMCSPFSAPNTAPASANRSAASISARRMRYIRCRRAARPELAANGVGVLVDALAQFLARLEMRYVLARQGDRRTGLRIAAHARRTKMQGNTAEAANFDAFAIGQCLAHLLHYAFHRQFHVVEREVVLARSERFDQLRFGHGA